MNIYAMTLTDLRDRVHDLVEQIAERDTLLRLAEQLSDGLHAPADAPQRRGSDPRMSVWYDPRAAEAMGDYEPEDTPSLQDRFPDRFYADGRMIPASEY